MKTRERGHVAESKKLGRGKVAREDRTLTFAFGSPERRTRHCPTCNFRRELPLQRRSAPSVRGTHRMPSPLASWYPCPGAADYFGGRTIRFFVGEPICEVALGGVAVDVSLGLEVAVPRLGDEAGFVWDAIVLLFRN